MSEKRETERELEQRLRDEAEAEARAEEPGDDVADAEAYERQLDRALDMLASSLADIRWAIELLTPRWNPLALQHDPPTSGRVASARGHLVDIAERIAGVVA